MIQRTAQTWQNNLSTNWKRQLQEAVTDPKELLQRLRLDMALLPAAQQACQQFPLRVPLAFVERMEVGNIDDPLLKQVLPLHQELINHRGYTIDPVGEQGNTNPGLIQKYRGRALLLVNGHCAVNCRYCFRRHFPYEDNRLSRQQWQATLDHIRADTSIEEVIYSGGDPLASNDKHLGWLSQEIAAISHIKRLRIHSRLPVVIPDRVNDECLEWLCAHPLQTVFVLHINHPNEIDTALAASIGKLKQAGITLLNQTVLLRGINDDVTTLKTLSEALFAAGVLPYYLHLLDPVSGAAHFDTPKHTVIALYQQLQQQLSGYLVPKLVQEISGEPAKTLINTGA